MTDVADNGDARFRPHAGVTRRMISAPCAGSHCLAREIARPGHTVRPIAAMIDLLRDSFAQVPCRRSLTQTETGTPPVMESGYPCREDQDERMETALGRRLPLRPDTDTGERVAAAGLGLPLHRMLADDGQRFLPDLDHSRRGLRRYRRQSGDRRAARADPPLLLPTSSTSDRVDDQVSSCRKTRSGADERGRRGAEAKATRRNNRL
jgi:hypothetical protein